MRKLVLISLLCLVMVPLNARDFKTIELLPADKKGGLTVMEALWKRQATRTIASRDLSVQELSNLVWSAVGINRPADGRRTSPTALNVQDVEVYVCLPEGIYHYDARKHLLVPVAKGDHRALVAGSQDFVKTVPVCLILVSDLSKFQGDDKSQKMQYASLDVGIVSQNISIYCAAKGLATVPRAYMDRAGLKKVLNLKETQEILLNHPVGYPQ